MSIDNSTAVSEHKVARVAAWLSHLIDPDQIVEMRAIGVQWADPIVFRDGSTKQPTFVGTFRGTELDAIARAGLEMSGSANVYLTSNPLNPERFQRQAPRLQKSSKSAKDEHVLARKWLFLDLDRPKHLRKLGAATPEHRERLLAFTYRIRDYLTSEGFPAPRIITSGNGFYLRYRIESAPFQLPLPQDDVLKLVLEHLADKFNCDDGEVDTGVFNPARIYRMVGTLNIKHDPLPGGSHPRCVLLEAPPSGHLESPSELCQALASRAPSVQRRVTVPVSMTPATRSSTSVIVSPTTSGPSSTVDEHLDRRIRSYMPHVARCVEFHKGDHQLFEAACIFVRGFALTAEAAYPYLSEYNNRYSLPPWGGNRLWYKLRQAECNSTREWGYIRDRERPLAPIGYEGLSSREISALVSEAAQQISTLPPEDCAVSAAADVQEEITHISIRCQNRRPVLFEKDGIPFVCDRDCGNRSNCRNCCNKQLFLKTREGNDYVLEVSGLGQQADWRLHTRRLYAALLPDTVVPGTKDFERLRKAIVRAHGERCSILTGDPEGMAAVLDPNPALSGFVLEDNKVKDESGIASTARLWRVSLPPLFADIVELGGFKFRKVTAAVAIRSGFEAVRTVPAAPQDGSTFKPYHESHGWGIEQLKVTTNVNVIGPSAFKPNNVLKILQESSVEPLDIQFDPRNGSAHGVGWYVPPAQSLALSLWIGGVDSPESPTVDRVIDLARHWLPLLPTRLGKGCFVEQVLRKHIWHMGLYDITDELAKADQEDRAREEVEYEAQSILRDLKEQYRGREHEATGLIAYLLT